MKFLLLHRIELTDAHPGYSFAAIGALIVLAGALERAMP